MFYCSNMFALVICVIALLDKRCACFKEWWEDSKVTIYKPYVFIYWS